MNMKMSTDWILSKPVFYNEKSNKISNNINDIVDYRNLEFDGEGLYNYLNYGYSVFGQSPIKHIKFLAPNQEIIIVNNKLNIIELDDPVYKYLDVKIKEKDLFDLMIDKVQCWEQKSIGDIVIPTSGGLDSRLLNTFIKNKKRIKSFTYGVSDNQSQSYEVEYAKALSKKLGTDWEQIELGDYNKYIDEWNDIFGVSTHSHGMYQIEFYKKIISKVKNPSSLLSGIIGDGWSGNVIIPQIDNVENVKKLGYSHNMNSDGKYCLLKKESILEEKYFENNKDKLKDYRWRIIESMRMKMILLSYLTKIPNTFGLSTYSPFLDIEIAISMLNLPESRRNNRLWQREYLETKGLNFEKNLDKIDVSNTLNLQAMIKSPLELLDINLLKEIIDEKYIESINKIISSAPTKLVIKRKINSILSKKMTDLLSQVGIPSIYGLDCIESKAYNAYLTLKPLEKILIQRNMSC